jgi:CO/xanthine dehydrogenase FAD-binding subunit
MGHTTSRWEIACSATLQAVVEYAGCPGLFIRTLTGSTSWQLRNRTSIDRVLTTPSTALSWFAALLALGATVSVEDRGDLLLEAFLEHRVHGRLLTLQVPVAGMIWGEAHVARTPSDDPIVAAVAAVRVERAVIRQARLALTGVWPRPVALAEAASRLVGGPLDAGRIQQVADAVVAEVSPKGDFLGSSEYRRAMAGVMARRALETCQETIALGQQHGEASDD